MFDNYCYPGVNFWSFLKYLVPFKHPNFLVLGYACCIHSCICTIYIMYEKNRNLIFQDLKHHWPMLVFTWNIHQIRYVLFQVQSLFCAKSQAWFLMFSLMATRGMLVMQLRHMNGNVFKQFMVFFLWFCWIWLIYTVYERNSGFSLIMGT